MKLLGQQINRFNLITIKDKLIAITKLDFPKILLNLEYYLRLIGYLRQFILIYLIIIELLK